MIVWISTLQAILAFFMFTICYLLVRAAYKRDPPVAVHLRYQFFVDKTNNEQTAEKME